MLINEVMTFHEEPEGMKTKRPWGHDSRHQKERTTKNSKDTKEKRKTQRALSRLRFFLSAIGSKQMIDADLTVKFFALQFLPFLVATVYIRVIRDF